MPLKAKLLLIAFLTLSIFTACRTQATSSPNPPSPTDTQTPLHTQPSKTSTATSLPSEAASTATATSLPAPEASAASLTNIQMVDEETGWAWSSEGRLLRTVDGGKNWIDRTPEGYQYTGSGFFLDAQTAWVPAFLQDSNRFGLLYTIDGGQSWVQYPQGPASGLYFKDTLNGWAVSGDVGAGNVYYSLSQTSDGGKTWSPIPVKQPSPEPGLEPGTIHLCNICNDAFYYDPARQIIVYGDMGSMEPSGAVQIEVSFDLGNKWQKQTLTLPQGEADALVAPNPPIFFNDQDGLLPVHLIKMKPDFSYGDQKLIFYATQDGGSSWSLLPTILDAVPLFRSIQVDSSQDIFTICNNTLCASHDKARTWQTVSSNLDFTTTDTRTISTIDFIDSSTGWVLVLENETTRLYHTTDGGAHWSEISPLLVPASPPTVRVDTSIPTPTTAPTATLEMNY